LRKRSENKAILAARAAAEAPEAEEAAKAEEGENKCTCESIFRARKFYYYNLSSGVTYYSCDLLVDSTSSNDGLILNVENCQ